MMEEELHGRGAVALKPREVPSLWDLAEPDGPSLLVVLTDERKHTRPWGLKQIANHRMVWLIAIGVVALLARLIALTTSNDIFIDEITYANVARNIAGGRGVTLYGQPFALHPPAALGLFALAILAFGIHGGTESVIFSLRHVDVVLGAGICMLTYLLVERAASRAVALAAAALIAIDPLVITYDSRVMLEAPAQFAAVSAFLFLAVATGARGSSRWRWLVAAGVAAAAVLCIKETFGLVVGLALVVLVLTGWIVSRREAATVLGLALFGYAISVVTMGLSYGFATWWHAQTGGASRLIGTSQITGFNSPQVHVSIVSRFLADLSTFAVSYLLLACGTLAALGLLVRLKPWRSPPPSGDTRSSVSLLVAIWTLAASAYLVYATLVGTIEEQMYYIVLLPAAASLCLWFADGRGAHGRPWVRIGTALLALALIFDTAVWAGVHSRHDDEYRRMLAWEAVHVPPTAVVSATEGLSQFLLARGVIGQWNTVPELKAHHVDFVVVNLSLVKQGYGLADPSFEQFLGHRGRLVFQANGTTDISLRIYDTESITGGSGGSG
jgi:4-amino-4-deoxy-L-arabinose transferase-like glycosyltransferase